jgi:hypothetical protein
MNESFNLNLSFTTYIRLSGIINRAVPVLCHRDRPHLGIDKFLFGFKKGSKQIRNIFLNNSDCLEQVQNSFKEVTQLDNVPRDFLKSNLGLWDINLLPNDFCSFIFKFVHNRLGINTRTSHFSENSRWCTFCCIIGRNLGPFDDETFTHLFVSCPTVKKVHDDIQNSLLEGITLTSNHWLGVDGDNLFLRLFLLAIQYQIWCAKLSNHIPNGNYCAGESIYLISQAVKCNKKINQSFANLDCLLSRLWGRLCRPRW